MKRIKNLVILGLLVLVGLLVVSGCVSSVRRGHNFYYVYGDYRPDTQGTGFMFFNNVPDSRMRLYWDVMPLCEVKGGPCDITALCTGENFDLEYKASPRAGYRALSLSVKIQDETESRSLHPEKVFAFILPVYYSGSYLLIFSGREGNITPEIQSSGEMGGYFPYGYW